MTPARAAALREIAKSPLPRANERIVMLVGHAPHRGASMVRGVWLGEALRAHAVLIVSGLRGVLECGDVAASDVDISVSTKPLGWRRAWARDICEEIARRSLGSAPHLRALLSMPATMSDPIVEHINVIRQTTAGWWLEPIDLLRGLKSHERVPFLEQAIAKAERWSQ